MFIVVWIEACRINSCCTFIGAPVSSSHERYVWRNVCQPIPPNFPASTLRVSWMRTRLPFAVGSPCQHHTPGAAPHVGHATTQHPEGRRCRFWISVGWYGRFVIGFANTHPSSVGTACLLQAKTILVRDGCKGTKSWEYSVLTSSTRPLT